MSGPKGKGALGCTASNKTMAVTANVNYSNFSAALGDLIRWGYIEKRQITGTFRALRVMYDALPTGKGVHLPTGKGALPTGKEVFADEQMGLRPPEEISTESHGDSGHVYTPSKDTFFSIAPRRGENGQGAEAKPDPRVTLAGIGDALAAGGKMAPEDRAAIDEIVTGDHGPAVTSWARRLLREYGEAADAA
jgi:hypothetical protein